MSKKMTAVEWLVEQLDIDLIDSHDYIVKAKAMEKEQMEKMYNHAMWALVDGNGHGQKFDEYYKETYEQNKDE